MSQPKKPRKAKTPKPVTPTSEASRKTGRPYGFKQEYVRQVAKLCALGATDREIADFFDVNIQTIRNWAANEKEFFDALKMGKEQADERVERSLYQRAIGYHTDAEKVFQYQGEVVRAPVREHIAPDTTACIFWLKNRRREQWRDRQDHEHNHKHSLSDEFEGLIRQLRGGPGARVIEAHVVAGE